MAQIKTFTGNGAYNVSNFTYLSLISDADGCVVSGTASDTLPNSIVVNTNESFTIPVLDLGFSNLYVNGQFRLLTDGSINPV